MTLMVGVGFWVGLDGISGPGADRAGLGPGKAGLALPEVELFGFRRPCRCFFDFMFLLRDIVDGVVCEETLEFW